MALSKTFKKHAARLGAVSLAALSLAGCSSTLGARCSTGFNIGVVGVTGVDQRCEQRVTRATLATQSPDTTVRAGAVIAQGTEDPALAAGITQSAANPNAAPGTVPVPPRAATRRDANGRIIVDLRY